METKNRIQMDSTNRYLALLQEYRDTIERLFPTLTSRTLDSLSISYADALFMGHFLDRYPQRVAVLERGVLLGTSTFFLASHPKVSKVVGVGPNPLIAEAVPTRSNSQNGSGNREAPGDLRVLEVASASLAEHVVERRKIELYDDIENPAEEATPEPSIESSSAVLREADFSADGELVVLFNGLQNREAVAHELKAIFYQHPHSIVILGNCRGARGPFVQAGVVDFMDEAQDNYHFRVIGDLGLGLASSNLGVVYPDQVATQVSEALIEVSGRFSERLDPLRLLQQEEELVENLDKVEQELSQARRSGNELKKQNNELGKQISTLKQRIEHLNNHYSSRRYKFADATMDKVLRVKSLKRFIR